MEFFKKIKNFILDLIFPIECLGCGREEIWLCSNCLNQIPQNSQAKGILLLNPNQLFLNKILIASNYQNSLLQETIHNFKYKFIFDLSKPLGNLLISFLKSLKIRNLQSFILIPIPLHPRRSKFRGFNQSELLAFEIARKFNLRVENKILIRKKNTLPQMTLNKKQRGENIKEAFSCLNAQKISNKKVILVDDVLTTGATIQECARILKKAGAKEIWGLVLAKG